MSTFFHLTSTGIDPCTLEHDAYEAAVSTWLCADCVAPLPSVEVINVQIQEVGPRDVPLTSVTGTGVQLARRDFLDWLGAERVRADLYVGVVVGAGKLLRDWATVRGRQRVIIRGSEDVAFRRCGSCGQLAYFATGPRYLYPAPPPGVSIWESDLGLLVSPEVFAGRSVPRWPKLDVEELEVVQRPRDGLGELT